MKKAIFKALRFIMVINLVAVLFLSQSAFAEEETANVSYNGKEKTVTVIANDMGAKGAAAIITISKDEENTIMNIARTDKNGTVTHTEIMPESFGGGRYNVTVATKKKTLEGYFIYPLAESINSVLPIINSKETVSDLCQALKDNSDPLAIDMLIFEEIAEKASKVMFALKPDDGYGSAAIFLESYNNAISAVYLNDGKTPADVFSKYGAAFGFDAGEYQALTDAEKALIDVYLKNADYTLLSVTDTFYEGKAVSQLGAADSWSVMRDKIEENEETLDFDTTYFDDLKNTDEVYQEFFSEFTGKENIDELRDLFLEVSERCYDKEKDSGSKSSSKGSGGGGGGGAKISVPKAEIPAVPEKNEQATNAEFADMAEHWAKDAVKSLSQSGIIGGFPDGTFKPDESVTRAQFTVMVAKALKIESDEKSDLSDVLEGSWYEKSVNAAVKAGIIGGMGDGKFCPDEYIKRQDALLILYRAFGEKLEKGEGKTFADSEKISDYAKEAIKHLSAAGIANGTDTGEIMPLDATSRAEVAAMLARILETGRE